MQRCNKWNKTMFIGSFVGFVMNAIQKITRRWAYYCQLLIHSCANHTELYTVEWRGDKRMSCQRWKEAVVA
jgi:hypothetical protein